MKLVWLTEARYVRDYVLNLTFNDGTCADVDFSKILDMERRIYAPLKDLNVFKQFCLDSWTLTWDEGKIDITPERLYEAATR